MAQYSNDVNTGCWEKYFLLILPILVNIHLIKQILSQYCVTTSEETISSKIVQYKSIFLIYLLNAYIGRTSQIQSNNLQIYT